VHQILDVILVVYSEWWPLPLSMLQSIHKELKTPTKDRDPRDGILSWIGAKHSAIDGATKHDVDPRRFGSIVRSNGCLEDISYYLAFDHLHVEYETAGKKDGKRRSEA
jgi:hypothetical protein